MSNDASQDFYSKTILFSFIDDNRDLSRRNNNLASSNRALSSNFNMYYVDKGRTIGLGGFYNDEGINFAHSANPNIYYILQSSENRSEDLEK